MLLVSFFLSLALWNCCSAVLERIHEPTLSRLISPYLSEKVSLTVCPASKERANNKFTNTLRQAGKIWRPKPALMNETESELNQLIYSQQKPNLSQWPQRMARAGGLRDLSHLAAANFHRVGLKVLPKELCY